MKIFSRLYGKIIKYFLQQQFFQIDREEQAGFRASRCKIDHVFSLKHLIGKHMFFDQTLQ